MNERFKELRNEAFRLTEWQDLDYDAILEKFGELVVNQSVFELIHESTKQSSTAIQDFSVTVANRIKQHFGIE